MLRAPAAVALALAALVVLRGSGGTGREVSRLADTLRDLYAERQNPWERWGRKAPVVPLEGGGEATREEAYRDRALFPDAAAWLLASGLGDDAPLGAWLLGTLPPSRAREAEDLLVRALAHPDPRTAFEAARSLAAVGSARSLPRLRSAARTDGPAPLQAVAAWAAERVAERHGLPREGRGPGRRLTPGFRKGVAWWRSEAREDAGAKSFRRLASLGVDWVSIHTWDPLQRAADDPRLAEPRRRLGIAGFADIVRSAHAAGLRVMLKPHLEMRRYEPRPEDLPVLAGPDAAARRKVLERLRAEAKARQDEWHNLIEMRSEADWQEWFRGYGRYLLEYAAQARDGGADMFCVGRELDRTVVIRERDWRRLIARVREVYPGPLVYSANFDTFHQVGFWDALDFVGVSAYFPLSRRPDPDVEELQTAWEPILSQLEDVSRRFDRPLILTELGYPSTAGAAAEPWRETGAPADPWMQARCYEAALRAFEGRDRIEGAFWWLWEGTAQPPFRDPSFSIQGKPAAFVVAGWFKGLDTTEP